LSQSIIEKLTVKDQSEVKSFVSMNDIPHNVKYDQGKNVSKGGKDMAIR